MEILIAVFSGAAFLALIAYLWNSDAASKQDKHGAAKEEALLPERVNQPNEAPLTLSTVESEPAAELQQRIEILNREHAETFKALEEYREKATANQFELKEAQASATRTSQRVVELEADNSLLQRQLAEMHAQQSSRQDEIASLDRQLAKLGEVEQQVGDLQKEKAELIEQLQKFQTENAANERATLALQNLEAKQSEYEGILASLREENHRLLAEITGLQSSLRDKIKTQLDGLQELYRNLTPGLN